MTDNEKRAHDLALLYIKGQIDQGMIEIHDTNEVDIGLFTEDYLNIYSYIFANLDCDS